MAVTERFSHHIEKAKSNIEAGKETRAQENQATREELKKRNAKPATDSAEPPKQTVEDLKPARELNSALTIAILPNRIHGSTKTKTITSILNELDATILDNFVPSKNLFTQSSTILPEKEYLAITKEILSLV